ncbi:30S ribosomal protein S13 [Candidatus Collierbacteria bacterium RIFCSPLOWO2_01_FULL_50_23]|uniref:Small ribosomal subunit protein uS13 n=2 Tax=Candidatus Collieribacteriota TaxID=1752725 RepID=A0A1F5EWK3_9BACT|nr:MAG: 30S ribosomal protein S13 [Candidatus Collierbacteria bacterium RIFCSPHIGHO2_02_FULL_49_10]OGD72168.1 MAG: 30S ribosomal protein S13 [Candidatus Collierbacteria bacterium RIFCSPHIGHO2_01_FULL_50_25]OGD74956.1 MAG: 30S ribosomal protein S13 [Candidatus Collierbacteria bacterium RIFCSPLOWO2_01_FULL_50_23]
MARIAGIDLPNEKRLDVALTYVYGIGKFVSQKILAKVRIDPAIRVKNLTSEQINLLQKEIETMPVEGELKKIVRENIQTMKRIQSYRGLRHSMKLPVRGQRTRTNARTLKGKRKTVGAMTKEAREKMEPTGTPAAK